MIEFSFLIFTQFGKERLTIIGGGGRNEEWTLKEKYDFLGGSDTSKWGFFPENRRLFLRKYKYLFTENKFKKYS